MRLSTIVMLSTLVIGFTLVGYDFALAKDGSAGVLATPVEVSLYTLAVIAVTSTVQSIFGVGVLLFGTPLLLLQYEKLTIVLPIVLPISIAINLFQIVRHFKYIDLKFYKRLVLITVPLVILFLTLVLFVEAKFNNLGIGIVVGVFMLLVSLKSYSPTLQQLLKNFARYEKTYLAVTGIVHGLTNL